MTPSKGLIIYQKGSQNPEKTLYLPLWFIIKDTTQEKPDGRDAQGKVWGGGVNGASMTFPGVPTSQHLNVFTYLDVVRTP